MEEELTFVGFMTCFRWDFFTFYEFLEEEEFCFLWSTSEKSEWLEIGGQKEVKETLLAKYFQSLLNQSTQHPKASHLEYHVLIFNINKQATNEKWMMKKALYFKYFKYSLA
jgi:hypothetical protein